MANNNSDSNIILVRIMNNVNNFDSNNFHINNKKILIGKIILIIFLYQI